MTIKEEAESWFLKVSSSPEDDPVMVMGAFVSGARCKPIQAIVKALDTIMGNTRDGDTYVIASEALEAWERANE